MSKENNSVEVQDANLQFLVLLNIIVERIEFLEENKFIYGNIKSFLKNGKTKFEDFIKKVFAIQDTIEGQTALEASTRLLVMQQRVEKALLNEYILTVEERRERAFKILSKYMITPMVEKAMEEMEQKNLFNF